MLASPSNVTHSFQKAMSLGRYESILGMKTFLIGHADIIPIGIVKRPRIHFI